MTPALVFMVLVASGCATPTWRFHEKISYQKDLTVEIERLSLRGEAVDAHLFHPASVPEDQVLLALQSLENDTRTGDQPRWIIDPDLTPSLATAITEGLSKATPSSRVRFWVTNPERVLWILPTRTATRGVAFVSPRDTLNLVFDVVDESLDFDEEVWGDPTVRTVRRVRISLPPGSGLEATFEKPQWLALSVGDTTPVPAAAAPTDQASSAAGSTSADTRPTVEPPPAGDASEVTPPSELTHEQVLERLRSLEKMYEEGVITREEFEKIRRRLLFGEGS